MSNRATRLHDDFIRALKPDRSSNFRRRDSEARADRKVIDAWRALFGELGNGPPDDNDDVNLARALERPGFRSARRAALSNVDGLRVHVFR